MQRVVTKVILHHKPVKVVGSDWYIFWLHLERRWEYLPFGTLEAADGSQWEPLLGNMRTVAAAIGHAKKLCLVIKHELSSPTEETWLWRIYWRRGNGIYLLTALCTSGAIVLVL